MNKTLITTLCTMCVAVGLYAQGTVAFQNTSGSTIRSSLSGANLPAGTSYRVSLYFYAQEGVNNATIDAAALPLEAWTQIGTFTGINPVAGRFNGGSRAATTTVGTTAPYAAAPGASAWFQVRAWSALFGGNPLPTYEAAMATGDSSVLAGYSPPVYVPVTGNPPSVPDAIMVGLQGFSISPVPEPAAIGLGILGLGALLMLRRRK